MITFTSKLPFFTFINYNQLSTSFSGVAVGERLADRHLNKEMNYCYFRWSTLSPMITFISKLYFSTFINYNQLSTSFSGVAVGKRLADRHLTIVTPSQRLSLHYVLVTSADIARLSVCYDYISCWSVISTFVPCRRHHNLTSVALRRWLLVLRKLAAYDVRVFLIVTLKNNTWFIFFHIFSVFYSCDQRYLHLLSEMLRSCLKYYTTPACTFSHRCTNVYKRFSLKKFKNPLFKTFFYSANISYFQLVKLTQITFPDSSNVLTIKDNSI